VKGTPSPPPLLQKSCPQDFVNRLLIKFFTLAAPLQVAPTPEWVRLGAFAVPFSSGQIFHKIPSHRTVDWFNLLLRVVLLAEVLPWTNTEDVGSHLGVVLISKVHPWWDIYTDLLVAGEGDGGNHCLEINRASYNVPLFAE
jgi:hypothetical protein